MPTSSGTTTPSNADPLCPAITIGKSFIKDHPAGGASGSRFVVVNEVVISYLGIWVGGVAELYVRQNLARNRCTGRIHEA